MGKLIVYRGDFWTVAGIGVTNEHQTFVHLTHPKKAAVGTWVNTSMLEMPVRNLPAVIYDVIFDEKMPARIMEVTDILNYRNPKLAGGGHSIVKGFILTPWG